MKTKNSCLDVQLQSPWVFTFQMSIPPTSNVPQYSEGEDRQWRGPAGPHLVAFDRGAGEVLSSHSKLNYASPDPSR